MKSKISNGMKKIFKTLPYIVLSLLVGFTAVYAGTLTPPGAPAKTMKSLADLYQLIDEGANTPSTDFDTPGTVSSTMNSLNDIYNLMTTKISNIDTDTILVGATIFGKEGTGTSDANATASDIISPKTAYVNGVKLTGTATAGTPAPTFASGDQTTYSCEALATDPSQQPAVTLQTICGYHTGDGCSWNAGTSQCDGGEVTGKTSMTWYAVIASCSEKTDEGSTDWRLPTYPELVGHYLEYNDAGAPLDGFVADYYWSGTTYPGNSELAYSVNMSGGDARYGSKDGADSLARCAH